MSGSHIFWDVASLVVLLVDSRRRLLGGWIQWQSPELLLVDSRLLRWVAALLVDSRCCSRTPVDSGPIFVGL